jgi:cell division protein FtsB
MAEGGIMTHLGKLMLTENDGKNLAAYYAHRVHTLELQLESKVDVCSNLRGEITALNHKVNQLTTQLTDNIKEAGG